VLNTRGRHPEVAASITAEVAASITAEVAASITAEVAESFDGRLELPPASRAARLHGLSEDGCRRRALH